MEQSLDFIAISVAIIFGVVTLIQSYLFFSYSRSSAKILCSDIQELYDAVRIILFKHRFNIAGGNIDYSSEIDIIRHFIDSPSQIILHNYLHSRKSEKLIEDNFTLVLFLASKDNDSKLLFCRRIYDLLKTLSPSDYKEMNKIARKSKLKFPIRPVLDSNLDEYLFTEEDYFQLSKKSNQPKEDFIIWLYKEKQLPDPNIEFWYATLINDPLLLNQSINKGADRTITIDEIYNNYQSFYKDFASGKRGAAGGGGC